jgi:hypothetical protein
MANDVELREKRAAQTIVETRVVSPKGARVTETVFVLSSKASARLEIKGEVPARKRRSTAA